MSEQVALQPIRQDRIVPKFRHFVQEAETVGTVDESLHQIVIRERYKSGQLLPAFRIQVGKPPSAQFDSDACDIIGGTGVQQMEADGVKTGPACCIVVVFDYAGERYSGSAGQQDLDQKPMPNAG
jgi:hypothetical protein